MAIFNPSEVTGAGHALLAQVLAGTCKLRFTAVQAGDGHFSGDVMDLTELVNYRIDGRIVSVREIGAFAELDCIITNEHLDAFMEFREVGIRARGVMPGENPDDEEEVAALDETGILFAYTNAGNFASPMGPFNGVWLHEELFTIRVYTANTTDISAAITPTSFASEILYSNILSGLNAKNVQDAIDELIGSVGISINDAINNALAIHNTDPNAHQGRFNTIQAELNAIMSLLTQIQNAGSFLGASHLGANYLM